MKAPRAWTPPEGAATVKDWRGIQDTLVRADKQLDFRLREESDGPGRGRLLQERAELRTLVGLCDAILAQAEQEQREAPTLARAIPQSERLAAFRLQMNDSKLRAIRSAHTVLVVDDHAPTRYVATRLLQRAGYQVAEAATGEEALVRAYDASALLLDVNLPDLNGVEVCQVIKKQSRLKPIVLMSAVFTDELHRDAGKSAGADLYLTSLLDGEQLASSFDGLLSP